MNNFLDINSGFVRNILKLMTGTVLAQAIPLALSPVLTRIYSPEDFGGLAVFMSISAIVSVIATLRYELAIIQPHDDKDSLSLIVLSLLSCTIISLFTLLIVIVFKDSFALALNEPKLGNWLLLLPLAILLLGYQKILLYWNIRKENYSQIAGNKVVQSSASAAGQISFGSILINSGLIFGYLVGLFISFLYFLRRKSSPTFSELKKSKTLIIKNATIYKKLPIYSTWGALADTASVNLPVFVITKFYELTNTGAFSLTFRVLSLPMSLISQPISQVLFQKVSKLKSSNPSKIKPLVIKVFITSSLIMLPFVSVIFLFGEDIFAFVFGEAWKNAGSMATILVFAVAIRFVVSPLSSLMALEENIKLGSLWQVLYFISLSITLSISSQFSLRIFLNIFVIHEVILYLLYFYFILKASNRMVDC